MSLSPNSPALFLETPPASPITLAVDFLVDSPVNLQDLPQPLTPEATITPAKRTREYERGQKRKRIDEKCSSLAESQDNSEEMFWGTGGSSPREVETDVVGLGPEQVDHLQQLGYFDFVDAVLADIAPFYQISRTLFVSTGWNSKTKTCTVSALKQPKMMEH
jgi:hypothetical protein